VIKSATVSETASGKYYCSILTQIPKEKQLQRTTVQKYRVIGLDYSSPHFYVDNNGNCADTPHLYRNMERKLIREQRKLSRMIGKNITGYTKERRPLYAKELKECKNIQKQMKKIAVIHEKISNARKDRCHKLSREITNSCDAVILEDINS